jgi:hypothetical protein
MRRNSFNHNSERFLWWSVRINVKPICFFLRTNKQRKIKQRREKEKMKEKEAFLSPEQDNEDVSH